MLFVYAIFFCTFVENLEPSLHRLKTIRCCNRHELCGNSTVRVGKVKTER